MASKAIRLSHNVWSNKFFAIAIGAIIIIFAIYHWVGKFHAKYSSGRPSRLYQPFFECHRAAHRFLGSTIFGLLVGRWLLYLVYWSINLILLLTDVDLQEISYVAKRLGWISVANLVLLTFLSLRNTPLAPLCGQSYEKIRPLHKTSGYTCITTSVLHGIVYLSAWSEKGELNKMTKTRNFAGAIAGLAMVVIGISTITRIMRKYYEVFYVLHVALFMLILITVGMHRPDFKKSTVAIVIFAGCMWSTDRFFRLAKLCWYFFGNHASVTAMPDDTMRITLKRRVPCTPGSHGFLWIPSIRLIETHPFTILSNNPVELLIRVQDGFTRDVYDAARKEPGKVMRCSMDGGYGQTPDFSSFDSTVLVAGGSGASFTFAVALDLLEVASCTGLKQTIDFIWIVRKPESLVWFEKELSRLQESPCVNLFVYVTCNSPASTGPLLPSSTTPTEISPGVCTIREKSGISSTEPDVEKSAMMKSSATQAMPYFADARMGRPDIASHVSNCATRSRPGERVCVGVCGPVSMIHTTRKAVSRAASNPGASITFHSEEFGW